MNFIFIAKLIEVFVHMLFKSGLLSQTDWENMALTFSKCSTMVKFWTLNDSLLQVMELEQSS